MAISNNKRIAKNTLMLYFRMMLIMGVTLYTSRVVLEVLGVEDFGIYNVVGGIVAMFGFLNSSMAITTQRFLNFEMGKENMVRVNQFFSLSMQLHFLIALGILFLAETIGLWFLNTQLTIPAERMVAANWVFQFSLLSAMVTIIQVPYNASIIAHERMDVYAYISILEASIKLGVVYMLVWFGFDKLKMYAVLMFLSTLLVAMLYQFYCHRMFATCSYRFFWDKNMFKDLFRQSSWNLLGTSAIMFMNQGSKVVLNIFYGVALNAAAGIASQVSSAITQFVTNFLTAIRPQVVKAYAEGRMKEMYNLIYKGATFSYYLIFFLTVPILFQTETVLSLWLKHVPEYTVIFTRLVLIDGLLNTVTISLRTAIQASGKVKIYQISVSTLMLLIIPISYLLFYIGFPPQVIYWVTIVISVCTLIIRIVLLHHIIHLPVAEFLREVIGRILLVSFPVVGALFAVMPFLPSNNLPNLIVTGILSSITILFSVYIFGLSRSMRQSLTKQLSTILRKINS